jgi:acyl dehydratase
MGYGGLINHGVFAYNVIAHEFVRRLGKSGPLSLRQLSARFSGPVKPGDDIDIEVWNIGRSSEGWDQIRWFAKVVGSHRPCLSDGTAFVKPQYETGKL